MSYDHELILLTPKAVRFDEVGNQVEDDPEETAILCKLKSIGRTEFYNATVAGLKPEIIFVIHGYEYDGQKLVKFEGIQYRVIKTYSVDFEEMELTCERVVADGQD